MILKERDRDREKQRQREKEGGREHCFIKNKQYRNFRNQIESTASFCLT